MDSQYISRGFGLWACLFAAFLAGLTAGCSTTGIYGQNIGRLDTATQAFFERNWPQARREFASLAAQSRNPDAVTAGTYGLACVNMAAAVDVPGFLKALDDFPREPDNRFRNQNPELFIFAVHHGFRLMEKKDKEQTDQILRLGREEKSAAQTIRTLEQTIEQLKHQIQVLERIDQELQEKRNPS